MTFAIIDKQDELSRLIAEKIRSAISRTGEEETKGVPDTVFVVGGDGTLLYAVHQYINELDRVRFYGIHTGTLGFLTDYKDSELDAFLRDYIDENVKEQDYPLLEITAGEHIMYGLNEVRVENMVRTQVIDVIINGTLFETFRGTGLSVCTQLGSTAYNRSLGGAVVEDGLDVLQMCEVAGIHHIKFRSLGAPIILGGNAQIELRSKDYEGAMMGADSDLIALHEEKSLRIRKSERKVRMLKGREIPYFYRLRSLF